MSASSSLYAAIKFYKHNWKAEKLIDLICASLTSGKECEF